jgi:ABC-2 type transport system permease protein
MKGLIIKDLIALKKQVKIFLILAAFYIVFSIVTKNTGMFGAMVILLCVMMPITTMSFDEHYKWDRYALSLPISRKTLVISKYVLGILLDLAAIVIVAPTSIVIGSVVGEMEINESLVASLAIGGVALLFLSIILPIIFKFGVEKGRMLMMTIFFVPAILVMLISSLGIALPNKLMLEKLTIYLPFVLPVMVIGVLLISIYISIGIYTRKEF